MKLSAQAGQPIAQSIPSHDNARPLAYLGPEPIPMSWPSSIPWAMAEMAPESSMCVVIERAPKGSTPGQCWLALRPTAETKGIPLLLKPLPLVIWGEG